MTTPNHSSGPSPFFSVSVDWREGPVARKIATNYLVRTATGEITVEARRDGEHFVIGSVPIDNHDYSAGEFLAGANEIAATPGHEDAGILYVESHADGTPGYGLQGKSFSYPVNTEFETLSDGEVRQVTVETNSYRLVYTTPPPRLADTYDPTLSVCVTKDNPASSQAVDMLTEACMGQRLNLGDIVLHHMPYIEPDA